MRRQSKSKNKNKKQEQETRNKKGKTKKNKKEENEVMDQWLQHAEIKTQLKSILYPLATTLYNELYIYIWFICVYNVMLILMVVANFALLIHVLRQLRFSNAGGGLSGLEP